MLVVEVDATRVAYPPPRRRRPPRRRAGADRPDAAEEPTPRNHATLVRRGDADVVVPTWWIDPCHLPQSVIATPVS